MLNQTVNVLTLLTPGTDLVSYISLHTHSNKKILPEVFCVCACSLLNVSVLSCIFSGCRASAIQMACNEVFSNCKVSKHLQWIRSKPFQTLHIRYELGSGKK